MGFRLSARVSLLIGNDESPSKERERTERGKKTHSFCRELLWTADNKSGVIDTLSCVHPSNALNARQEVVVAATDDVQSRVKGMRYNSENERERERAVEVRDYIGKRGGQASDSGNSHFAVDRLQKDVSLMTYLFIPN